jgi:BASS family bile acid:Na+ symporter
LLLPLSLALIMFSLGLGLTPADFGRIVRQPRALLVGVVCHFILLPLVCFAMIKVSGMAGVFAVGFMILAASPTGTTSNLLTYLARGDVALALSFTAVASVLTIFTLPLIVAFALDHFAGSAQTVRAPAGMMMAQIFIMLGLPVAIGMFVRTNGRRAPCASSRWRPGSPRCCSSSSCWARCRRTGRRCATTSAPWRRSPFR